MTDFFQSYYARILEFGAVLADPDVPFVRYALIAGLLASVAFGINGTYVVTRRITYIAGAISHCVLGGIGAALYFSVRYDLAWLHPIHGAVVASLLAALTIGLVSLYASQREDTVIGALWALGMAVGALFLAKTPGYGDLMSYLFGDMLLITKTDLWLIAGLDLLVVLTSALFFNKLLAVCFDEEFTRVRGVNAQVFYLLLLCMIALTVVLLAGVVGIVMVIALLTLPAAVAGHFTRRMAPMMALAVIFCMAFTTLGLEFSYARDLPSGASIIVFAGSTYLAVVVGSRVWRAVRS